MGIKLDWEIEAEQATFNGLGEHPEAARLRRAARRRLLGLMLLVILVIGGIVGGVVWRLNYVQNSIEQQLRDTVRAEVNALKVGNIGSYLTVLRSQSDAWMLDQTDRFWEYQQLKLDHMVDLTGRVLDVVVEENRARALVEEVIDGQPYAVTWFYWRFEDGWRHVPMDVTFWGESRTAEGQGVRLEYADLDAPLAEALSPLLDAFWSQACGWVNCTPPLPMLTVRIVPDRSLGLAWSTDADNTLLVGSPLTGRAAVNTPLSDELRLRIGGLLAERLLPLTPVGATDAAFLYEQLRSWLAFRFVDASGALDSGLIGSIAATYSTEAVGRLVAAWQSDVTIAVLADVLGAPLEALNVDWRPYFQWRLGLEQTLLGQGEDAALIALYDVSYGDVAQQVNARLADPNAAQQPSPNVQSVSIATGTDGAPRACVAVQQPDGGAAVITFRLVERAWLRSAGDAACGT